MVEYIHKGVREKIITKTQPKMKTNCEDYPK